MRKLSFVAVALAVSLPLGSAFAEGEGAGNPFPYRAPGVTTDYGKLVRRSPDQDFFQYRSPAQAVTSIDMGATAPQNGNESSVQTANSLPHDANKGMQNYARVDSLRQYWASRGVSTVKTQLAQPANAPAALGHNG